MADRAAGDAGAARRRRERRLRSWAKHERLSIAMDLAEALHHSAGPSTKKVVERREGGEEVEYETHNAPLDKLEDVLKFVDLLVSMQEIVVPKISSLSRPPLRRVLPVPKLAEQLVDVPLPATGVVQAWVRDANGQRWSRDWDSAGRIYWWHPASGHVQWKTPLGIFWEIPSGYVVFSAFWFDSGYMLFPVYGGFCTNFLFLHVVTWILRSFLVLLSCSVFAAKSTGKLDFLVPRSC